MTIQVDVHADSMLRFSPNAPEGFVREIQLRLTRTMPVYGMGPKPVQREVSLLGQDRYSMFAPRGAVEQMHRVADRHGVSINWTSGVVSRPGTPIPVSDLGITPRDYQIEAVEFLHSAVQGMVILPCGGGKTAIGIVAILTLGEPALVVVPTTDLVEQWVARLVEAGAAIVRQGIGRGSAAVAGEVIVSTAAAFQNGRGDAVLESVGVVVVDECHRAPAPTWGDVVERCPARYRWGLTATNERADGLEWVLPLTFGETFEPASTEDLIVAGWLRRPSVYGVSVDWAPKPCHYEVYLSCRGCGVDWTLTLDDLPWPCTECGSEITTEHAEESRPRLLYPKAVTALVASEVYQDLLFNLAASSSDAGRTVLVLVPRKSLGVEITMRLEAAGHEAAFVSSRSGKAARSEAMRRMRDGEWSILVATSLADEGLDIPNLDCIILAGGGRAKGKAKQRAGRVARPQGKDPYVIDLVAGGPFESQWSSRKKAYMREYGAGCIAGNLVDPEVVLALFPLVEKEVPKRT